MRALDALHQGMVHTRRVRVLSEMLSQHLRPGASVLDVGTGDGLLARLLMERSGATLVGIDVLKRADSHIPVTEFDGTHIPFGNDAFDAVVLVDVVHHAEDPMALLREVVRVTRADVIIKDHLLEGLLAWRTLSFMDWVGNARHHVNLPYNYWRRGQWQQVLADLGLQTVAWTEAVPLYPWPFSMIFGRRLHFIAHLAKRSDSEAGSKP